jgi:hypothetical protein
MQYKSKNMKPIYFNKCEIDSQQGTQYVLRLFGLTCWISNHHPEYGWFRFFGRGLNWKHKKRGLSFSEQNGHSKYWKFGKWIVRYLSYR